MLSGKLSFLFKVTILIHIPVLREELKEIEREDIREIVREGWIDGLRDKS